MSEVNLNRPHSSQLDLSESDRYQKWRLLKDKLVARSVVAGGLSIIVAIVLIFFYLLYVVFPLLLSSHAESVAVYEQPELAAGNTLLLGIEEQSEVGVRFTDLGQAVFFDVQNGNNITSEKLNLATATVTSFAHGDFDKAEVAYGLSDGKVLVVTQQYKLSYPGGKRLITPSVEYPLGNQPVAIDASGNALKQIAFKVDDKSSTVVAKTSDGRLLLVGLTQKRSLFDDEVTLERSDVVLEATSHDVDYILLDKEQHNLYLANRKGDLSVYDVRDKTQPVLTHKVSVMDQSEEITSLEFLNGDLSLLIGSSKGELSQWSIVRDEKNHFAMQKLRSFDVSKSALQTINAEQRRKGMLVADAEGNIGIYNATSERELIKESVVGGKPVAVGLSPRADAFVIQGQDGKIHFWRVDNEHPDVSFSTLWQKVWYESYSKPSYTWQSSSASNDFEPKMSLIPLIFGTLKASFYAMLVAIPLSLLGAIYTGYFMAPGIRQYVKPGIEIMGALPTVILGFLAGLWLAPFVEAHLAGVFSLMMMVPLWVMIFAFIWQKIPEQFRYRIPEGWNALVLVPVVILASWFALAISPEIEAICFNGDLRTWMSQEFGIGYDQRNTLVVGFAMGFAVIPMIFSIAEDAIFSVPKHLTTGSLALGATTWQTMIKVVLLTASPGIFSAIMIGFGRAVGETMIVLMATGNTPVMDLSIFQGLRTLSANIAVEMPESEVNSTHYRVLFLAALVLFMFTFVVNTLAEMIRHNLRQKYSSL